MCRIGINQRKAYASALLELSAKKSGWLAVPPAFGKGDIHIRIQNIMHYQHTTKKAAAAAVTVSILVGGIFLTSRKSEAAVPAANTALSEQKETEQTAAPRIRTAAG